MISNKKNFGKFRDIFLVSKQLHLYFFQNIYIDYSHHLVTVPIVIYPSWKDYMEREGLCDEQLKH